MAAPFLLPLLVCGTVLLAATTAHRRLPPQVAARFLTWSLVLIAVVALPTVVLLALAFLAHVPLVGSGFEWCAEVVGVHGDVPWWMGAPAVSLLFVGMLRSARIVREHRRLRCHEGGPVAVHDDPRPFAVTLPGRGGRIVLSRGLVELLDDGELDIVLAHERAHAQHRHDRYLIAGELATSALPPLRSLASRLRYSLERWADEAAAARCGDRRSVAETLGKVALHGVPSAVPVAGFASLGVAGRVAALLDPPVRRARRPLTLALWACLAVAAGAGAYQFHHLEQLVLALCPH